MAMRAKNGAFMCVVSLVGHPDEPGGCGCSLALKLRRARDHFNPPRRAGLRGGGAAVSYLNTRCATSRSRPQYMIATEAGPKPASALSGIQRRPALARLA